MKLKTKLALGLSFLFVVILTFGILGIASINKLGTVTRLVLQDNYESLQYSNNMMKALEEIPSSRQSIPAFEINLKKQEANVTEPGEKSVTDDLRKNFNELKASPADTAGYREIRKLLQQISDLNQYAILRKNETAQQTAATARLWLTIIFVVLGIVAFTLVVNFPAILSAPIKALNEGIKEIAGKNYSRRIHLMQHDEFGDLAKSFNSMAERLEEYESSNLAKLQFEKSRIETIINQMRDGIIGLDDKKNILFLNAVAEGLLGITEQDILGKYAADVALTNDLMRTLLLQDADAELKIYANKRESYFTRDLIDVKNKNEVIGQVIVLKNITSFHELNEAKTNFIATVSHELKTPISSIKMSLQLLQNKKVGNLNDEQHVLLQSITGDAERLLKITGELLNISQIETGNIKLQLQQTSAESIVSKSIAAVQLKARLKHINIRVSSLEQLPHITADAEKTSWVLINLLANAIEYSPENADITVEVSVQESNLVFAVKDTGIGIEEKYQQNLFDHYFTVPDNANKNSTGLGLAISRAFITAQGGTIQVHSKINEGSNFVFTVPLAH